MAYGFVYLLGNRSMPDLYKIGCTERSPAQRAKELSMATGVPTHFDVICYWEGEEFQRFEKHLHRVFDIARFDESREFFQTIILREFVNEIKYAWKDDCLSFCVTKIGQWYLDEDDKRGPR